MDALYIIGGIGLFLLVILVLTGPLERKLYRCQACGFETYSQLEAAGHERLENAHRVT